MPLSNTPVKLGFVIPNSTGIYNPAVPQTQTIGGAVFFAQLIAQFLSVAFILGGVILLAMILWGGIAWMTAGGDQNKLKAAQGRLSNALIGFVILVAMRAIVGFVATVLAVPWLDTLTITWPIAPTTTP